MYRQVGITKICHWFVPDGFCFAGYWYSSTSLQLENTHKTRCVCETLMPPKWPFFEKCNLDIRP